MSAGLSVLSPVAPRDRFVAFAFAGADLLVEATPDGRVSFAAGAFRYRMGMDPEHYLGQHVTALVAPSDRVPLGAALAAVASRGRIVPMVLRLNDATRTPANVAAMLAPGSPPRLCVTFGPVPLAASEPHTGGVNARGFAREAEAMLRDGIAAEVSLLEVKGWHAVRDTLPAADQIALREGIASAVGTEAPGVVAGEIAEGRYGVITPGGSDLPAIVQRLEALLRASPAGRHMRVDSTGLQLAAGRLDPSAAARALRYALSQFGDGGAEAARLAGSGGGLAGVLAQAERQAQSLREMIRDGRFRMKFQPVVSLADRRVHHYESLLRPLGAPGGPPQGTQEFVTFVEAVGLAEELDCATTEHVLIALRDAADVSVAVNISGLSMQSGRFRERVGDLLARERPGGRLLVELTETAEIEDVVAAGACIDSIRAAGVPVCLDDFGAGAASFRYLREFHFDLVKIDGMYVQRATLGVRELGFVSSMVELAGGVGARVVAEMVETEEQARAMEKIGVEFGQGWLFGHPGMLPGMLR